MIMLTVFVLMALTNAGVMMDTLEMAAEDFVKARFVPKLLIVVLKIITIADMNECISSSGNTTCDVNAFCNNTIGGHTCQCLPGFEGNGSYCSKL